MNRSARLSIALVAAATILSPVSAQAHLVVTGMGPVYDGVSHFGLSPEDFLPVIVFGLFAGLRGAKASRLAMAALPLAWAVGGVVAMLVHGVPQVVLAGSTALLFVVIGGLLAANLRVSDPICALAGASLGAVRGLADLSGVSFGAAHMLTVLGMCASVLVCFATATSVTLPLQRAWMIVAARVSGSWLAAVGVLLGGWIARYGAAIHG